MTDTITLTGLVATAPRFLVTTTGLPIASFRLASTQRRYDRTAAKWIDAETNWYTITAFRALATNASTSIHKGDRIVLSGRLRIREWQSDSKSGTNIDVEAEALGHDLSWGTAAWTRVITSTPATDAESGRDADSVFASDTSTTGSPGANVPDEEFFPERVEAEAATPF